MRSDVWRKLAAVSAMFSTSFAVGTSGQRVSEEGPFAKPMVPTVDAYHSTLGESRRIASDQLDPQSLPLQDSQVNGMLLHLDSLSAGSLGEPTLYYLHDENRMLIPSIVEIADPYGSQTQGYFHYLPIPYPSAREEWSPTLPSQNEIDYAALQRLGELVMTEHCANLYNAYFPVPCPEFEWQVIAAALLAGLVWVAKEAAGGVIGNLAYEAVIEELKRRRERASPARQPYFEQLEEDMKQVVALIRRAAAKNETLRVNDAAKICLVADVERVRRLFQYFGGTHKHASDGACSWRFTVQA